MGITRFSTALGNSCGQQILNALDSGGGPGFLRLYDGVLPASPSTAITNQTLLATLTLSFPCATLSGKLLTFNAIGTGIAVASGVARFGRLLNSASVAHVDVNISSTGGGGSLILTSTAIALSAPIRVESLYIAVG